MYIQIGQTVRAVTTIGTNIADSQAGVFAISLTCGIITLVWLVIGTALVEHMTSNPHATTRHDPSSTGELVLTRNNE